MDKTEIMEIQSAASQLQEKAMELRKLIEQAAQDQELTTKHSWINEVETKLRVIRHDEILIGTRI